MPRIKAYRYAVIGMGEFPFDMLRYDRAFPTVEQETPLMGNAHRQDEGMRRIHLMSAQAPTKARWGSFGWRVEEVFPEIA